jgi:replicative DNA helicase
MITPDTTGSRTVAWLEAHGFKKAGANEWRGNSPFRAGSDSKAFVVRVEDDGEHGAWHDHPTGESGSLYEFAGSFGIEITLKAQAQETKRGYTGLADYAAAHYAPIEAFTAVGWHEGTHKGRPCLIYKLGGKTRYRMIDGNKPYYLWPDEGGGKPAWYGLRVAPGKTAGRALVLCNGEASTIAAQHHGLAACAWAGGEQRLPDHAITELKAAYTGPIILAYDCDDVGRRVAREVAEQLTTAGYDVRIADLQMTDHGDLADFCGLHTETAYAELDKRAVVYTPDMGKLADAARVMDQQVTQTHGDPDEAALRQLDQIEQHVERAKDKLRPVRVMDMADLARAALDPAKNAKRWPTLAIPELAALVGPLEPELYVIYGAPNMGKSWMAVSFAGALMKQGTGLMITTETRPDKWFRRIVSYQSRVPLDRVDDGIASEAERKAWNKVAAGMAGYPGAMMDMSSPTGKAIVRAALKVRKEQGLDWIVVDSATRMRGIGSNSYERTSNVAHALQDMARDFNVPVIITSQIGRDVGERGAGQKLPRMEDAYGSGAIEQDAGVVLGLYRHDYYVTRGSEVPDDATFPPNTARVILLKHRNRRVPPTNWANVLMDEGCGFYPYRAQTVNLNTMEGRTA